MLIKKPLIHTILFLSIFFCLNLMSLSVSAQSTTHKVKRGETLWVIAQKYNVPVDLIAKANQLRDRNRIKIDQVLIIPSSDSSKKSMFKNQDLYVGESGIYHRLKKGETIWELSRVYQVPIDIIIKTNKILSPRTIKVGQVIFIPMSEEKVKMFESPEGLYKEIRQLISLPYGVRPRNWKYIIIHHSATDMGNATTFNNYHKYKRHMTNGLAYHFVITNGRKGEDGKIEPGPRWNKQIHGGHVKSEYFNNYGIGICLVGNFEKYEPSVKQFKSTLALVQVLCAVYNIPPERVLGHSDVGKSVCPGRKFPMHQLKLLLKK